VIKVENVPKIGETVVDENLKPVGRIFDVFGPVSSPYAVIKPTTQEPERLARLASTTLYVLPSKRRKY